jgi:hypothetical protein
MKYDLDFLKNSKLAFLFELNFEESDPFLLCANFISEENSKIYHLKISEEIFSTIKKGQFLILQDLIGYHINNINLNFIKNKQNEKSLSPKGHRKKESFYSYNIYNNNNSKFNFKKAVNEAKKLYSPRSNFINNNSSILKTRPYSSGLIRNSIIIINLIIIR